MRRSSFVLVVTCLSLVALLSACAMCPSGRARAMPTAPAEIKPIIIDSEDSGGLVEMQGEWPPGVAGGDWGDRCLFAFRGKGECKFVWRPDLPRAGDYRVAVWFGGDPNADHATNSPFTVHHEGGKKTYSIDQTRSSDGWRVLGIHPFNAGKAGAVELTNDANGNVVADAVQFEFVE
ncbi:hypothetical protein AMJ85_10470 [candidate division BRC1 bacterium SM23_51]|nr:MAG: hypothetical protein AMJ85_10470 [candidate division BRC1 bacterium SM23_51]